MNGPSIDLYSDDEDVLEVSRHDARPMFQIPAALGNGANNVGANSVGTNYTFGAGNMATNLINARKVSPDVLSMSSSGGSSVSQSPEPSDYTETDDTGEDYSLGGGAGAGAGVGGAAMGGGRPSMGQMDNMAQRMAAERSRIEAEMREKQEILYQMDRLEAKGYRLPRKFTMQTDLEEMRNEYHRILREKEVDASVRFQRKMLMAAVTGLEYMNTRFDPFDLRLDGWSEQVHENINDYDDIFEELHEKYKSTGKKMAPELRLFLSLSGSAFMFHLTNSMFKQTPLPGVEQVLRSNPDLMRQFQHAAVNQYATNMAAPAGPPPAPAAAGRVPGVPKNALGGGGGGLFSMVGNLFGMSAAQATMPMSAAPPTARMPPPTARADESIETIIQDIHKEITSRPPSNANRIETMSVSDEEITSIIEDAADVGILGANSARAGPARRKAAPGKKTLQL